MPGIVVLYILAVLIGSLSVAMLRFPTYWIEFFRQANTRPGRKIDARVITRSTIAFQGVLALVFAVICLSVATSALVNFLSK